MGSKMKRRDFLLGASAVAAVAVLPMPAIMNTTPVIINRIGNTFMLPGEFAALFQKSLEVEMKKAWEEDKLFLESDRWED